MKKKNKKGAGRKIFDGKDLEIVIQKLEQVWGIGGTDKEASLFADISPAALSDYLKKHPEITERKEALSHQPILKARQEVVKGLDGNPEFSLKYLERKKSDEFSLKSRLEHSGDPDKPIYITEGRNPYDKMSEKEFEKELNRRQILKKRLIKD